MKNKTAIIILTYVRTNCLKESLKILLNSNLNIFIYHDKYKKEEHKGKNLSVKKFLSSQKSEKIKIIYRNSNYGLKNNYLSAFKTVFQKGYDSIIYIEDDLLLADNFIQNIKLLIDFYESNEKVISVSCNNFELDFNKIRYDQDIFFVNRPNSYGFATWKKKWMKFYRDTDFDAQKALKNLSAVKKVKESNFDIYAMMRGYKLKINNSIGVWLAWYTIYNDYICINTKNNFIENYGYDGLGENLGYKIQNKKKMGNIRNIKITKKIFYDSNIQELMKSKLQGSSFYRFLFNLKSDLLLLNIIKILKIKNFFFSFITKNK